MPDLVMTFVSRLFILPGLSWSRLVVCQFTCLSSGSRSLAILLLLFFFSGLRLLLLLDLIGVMISPTFSSQPIPGSSIPYYFVDFPARRVVGSGASGNGR